MEQRKNRWNIGWTDGTSNELIEHPLKFHISILFILSKLHIVGEQFEQLLIWRRPLAAWIFSWAIMRSSYATCFDGFSQRGFFQPWQQPGPTSSSVQQLLQLGSLSSLHLSMGLVNEGANWLEQATWKIDVLFKEPTFDGVQETGQVSFCRGLVVQLKKIR